MDTQITGLFRLGVLSGKKAPRPIRMLVRLRK
jgi:hypothetical protein